MDCVDILKWTYLSGLIKVDLATFHTKVDCGSYKSGACYISHLSGLWLLLISNSNGPCGHIKVDVFKWTYKGGPYYISH